MIEIIRSQEIKDYLHSIRYFLSDSAKATLVYNSLDHTREEILKSLEELAENTEDDQVKQQIMERLAYEKMVMNTFCTNKSEKFVYVVVDNDGETWGHFIVADIAMDYAVGLAKREQENFRIEKHLVVRNQDVPRQKNPIRCNLEFCNGMTDDTIPFVGYPDGILRLNKDGIVMDVWSNEIPKEQELDEFAPKRFENAFISIPFPAYFSKGHPVRHVLTNQYGVIGTSHEEWKEFVHRIDAGLLKVDYVDMSLTVFFLADDGHFFHEHVNPIYLETATPDDHMVFRAIDALCTYWSNEIPDEEQSVLRACIDYADSKRRKSLIETATTVSDILI